jgi:hypothetical protein
MVKIILKKKTRKRLLVTVQESYDFEDRIFARFAVFWCLLSNSGISP